MTDQSVKFSENLMAVAVQRGLVDAKELYRAMIVQGHDVTMTAVGRWWDGGQFPNVGSLLMLCDTLGCTPNDLLL